MFKRNYNFLNSNELKNDLIDISYDGIFLIKTYHGPKD